MTKTNNVIPFDKFFQRNGKKRQLDFIHRTMIRKSSHKMCKFLSILLLKLFHLLYVNSVVVNNSDNYLPLVLIKNQGRLEYPNRIEKATINEVLGFTGDTQFSKDDSKDQMFFCPVDSTNQLAQIEETNKLMQKPYQSEGFRNNISNNCLFPKNFEKEDALRCGNDPKPTIYQIKEGNPGMEFSQICGPKDNEGLLYKFAYEVCTPPTSVFNGIRGYTPLILFQSKNANNQIPLQYERMTVYEICYNLDESITIYTKHTLKSVNLLFDERLEHEKGKEHSMMADNYDLHAFGFDFQISKGFFQHLLENPLEQNEPVNQEKSDVEKIPNIYLAEKLVSPDDMITAVLKKTTFHFINVQPMQQELVEIWNYVGKMIRNNFNNMKTDNEIEIYTGAFTLKESENNLPKDWSAFVPHIWIKVLYERKNEPEKSPTLAIIMKNQTELGRKNSDINVDSTLKTLCSVDHCEYLKQNRVEWSRFSQLLGNVRCCPFNDQINSFFNINLIHGDTPLPIADLTYAGKKKTTLSSST